MSKDQSDGGGRFCHGAHESPVAGRDPVLLEMHNTGACTLAQDEESCVVFGMPKEAIKRGGVEKTVSLNAIGREIMQQM